MALFSASQRDAGQPRDAGADRGSRTNEERFHFPRFPRAESPAGLDAGNNATHTGTHPGPITEKQERLLQLNLQSGKRLAQMIGNMLDLSRLEARIVDYEMQTSDVADLMHNVVMSLAPRHETSRYGF